MKKLFVMFAVVAGVVLASCNNKPAEEAATEVVDSAAVAVEETVAVVDSAATAVVDSVATEVAK